MWCLLYQSMCVQAGAVLVSALPSTHSTAEGDACMTPILISSPILNLYLTSSGMHLAAWCIQCGSLIPVSPLREEASKSTFESRTVSARAGFGRAVSLFSFLHNRGVLTVFHRKWWKFLTFLMEATPAMWGRCSPKYVIASKQPRVLVQLINIEHGQKSQIVLGNNPLAVTLLSDTRKDRSNAKNAK